VHLLHQRLLARVRVTEPWNFEPGVRLRCRPNASAVANSFANTLILHGWETGLFQAEGEEDREERRGCIDKVSKIIIFVFSIEYSKI
jgi:hypothetical protein